MVLSSPYFIMLIPMVMIFIFSIQQSHLLMCLLTLEGLMLSLVMLLPAIFSMNASSMLVMSIIILTMGACEAGLGLSLLVLMTRFYGSDKVKSIF